MAAAEVKRQAVQIGVRVQPLHKHFGAEIQGIDLTQSLSQQQQGFLVAALEQYDALLFRDRQLRPADQQRTVQCFPHDEHVRLPCASARKIIPISDKSLCPAQSLTAAVNSFALWHEPCMQGRMHTLKSTSRCK